MEGFLGVVTHKNDYYENAGISFTFFIIFRGKAAAQIHCKIEKNLRFHAFLH